jgi:hypothetical protein
MLIRACCLAGVVAATFAGCGGDDPPKAATSPTITAAAPPTASAIAGQDKLPEQPQVALDFRKATQADVEIDPPAQGRIAAGALDVELREAGAARAAPRKQPPDDVQTVLAIARIADPRHLDGRAGIFCRGDGAGNGYELTLDRAGAVRLDRVAGGKRTTLAHGQARLQDASPPDSPVPLFLVCGRGDESGPNVVFTAGAQEAAGVRDPSPLPPGAGSRAGMVVDGKAGDSARFTVFTLTYGP